MCLQRPARISMFVKKTGRGLFEPTTVRGDDQPRLALLERI